MDAVVIPTRIEATFPEAWNGIMSKTRLPFRKNINGYWVHNHIFTREVIINNFAAIMGELRRKQTLLVYSLCVRGEDFKFKIGQSLIEVSSENRGPFPHVASIDKLTDDGILEYFNSELVIQCRYPTYKLKARLVNPPRIWG